MSTRNRSLRAMPFVLALAAVPRAHGQSDTTTVVRVADGVYTIVHADATEEWPHGNTTVVIGDDGVLVVDATYLPSRAEADIAEIRKLTHKPVKFLVNTHWHYDHINGNEVYRRTFPDLQIVAHHATRRLMDANAARYAAARVKPGTFAPAALDTLKTRLTRGTDSAGRPLVDSARATLRKNIAQRERELAELTRFVYAAPTLTFESSLGLQLGGREVHLLHFSRANTPGDAIVYLPAEKVLVTGDVLVHPVPYAYNSTPTEWIGTLKRLEGMDADAIVPGHGPVFRDKTYLRRVARLIESVTAQVYRLQAEGKTLDEVRRAVDVAELRRAFAGDHAFDQMVFDDSIVRALIERAWLEARGSA